MKNALTIDLEEYFQVHAFEDVIRRRDWERYPSRVAVGTHSLLRLLDAHGMRATFFVLGWVADRHPELVREITARGHEIATHGYWHQLIYRQTPEEFALDLRQALDAIGRCVDDRPLGYRAPGFSITRASWWALDVLRDHGFHYDSSIFPLVAHDRYGVRGAPRFAHRVENGLWEFPMSTWRFGGQNWPVAGGGYFRLYPLWVTRRAIHRLNAARQPAIVYLHPWEFDPEQPVVANAPRLSRFRHYVNLARTEDRLRELLGQFAFAPLREAFSSQLHADAYAQRCPATSLGA